MDTVEEMKKDFALASKLCTSKNKDYGDAQTKQGEIFKILFPGGVLLTTTQEFNVHSLLVYIIAKLCRLASLLHSKSANFESIDDTCMDMGNYSFMLKTMLKKGRK